MALSKAKPTSAGRRFVVDVKDPALYKGRPHRGLVVKKSKTGGRNRHGRITTRQRGGGHRQHYRLIDFKRNKDSVPARVERLEHDPNRSANIALLLYADGERRYIIAPRGLRQGDRVVAGAEAPIRRGNALPLSNIPVGTTVHCVELRPGKGAQLGRSAGAAINVAARTGDYVTLRLRSGETRRVHVNCRATVVEASNVEHSLRTLGKAGAMRWRGRRSRVRG